MNSPEDNTPPKFQNDHDALVFLMEKYHFRGGSIGAAGMGWDQDDEIDESAPEWAKNMASSFVYDLQTEGQVLNMAMESVDCQLSREDSKILLTRYWSSPILSEGPCVLQPRVLQEAIISILGIKTFYTDNDVDPCVLKWTEDCDTGRFISDTDDFVLYDSESEDITCDKDQALKILEALREPGMTEDQYWSSFTLIDSIYLKFYGLDGDYHYCITGETQPDDITESYLKSRRIVDQS
jgi:hypothetical protein